jgi:hypothetical protein
MFIDTEHPIKGTSQERICTAVNICTAVKLNSSEFKL